MARSAAILVIAWATYTSALQLRMSSAEGRTPLERLALSEPNAVMVRKSAGMETLAKEGTSKHSNYDAIREQLAQSRARSYEQDRKGCCSKAASYLDSTIRREQ